MNPVPESRIGGNGRQYWDSGILRHYANHLMREIRFFQKCKLIGGQCGHNNASKLSHMRQTKDSIL